MATEAAADLRQARKEEGKLKKRQKIEESGGIRPRGNKNLKTNDDKKVSPKHAKKTQEQNGEDSRNKGLSKSKSTFETNKSASRPMKPLPQSHRFGRVMESVPCRNKPRFSTVSIALPGSVLSNCQTKELRTLLVGQIARAATIYHVDEIIVFDDKLGRNDNHRSGWGRHRDPKKDHHHSSKGGGEHKNDNDNDETMDGENKKKPDEERLPRSNPQEFMARLLQYCECPQYLRRHFFPMHPDLQFAGLLAPVDAPHHVRAEDQSPYREGVVLPNKSKSGSGASLVNCGIRNRPVEIDRQLSPGIRCTVKIDPSYYRKPGTIKGTVVAPSAPREDDGTYWGYTTRLASSINEVLDGCPYEGGYDLKIGTSERGDSSVEGKGFKVPKYEHSLIVFGGVAGIEECVDADESIKLPGSQSKKLFDVWLNTCPYQGSRTIRTEEAVLISLSQLSAPLSQSARTSEVAKDDDEDEEDEEAKVADVEFSDEAPSEESSSDEGSSEEDKEDDD